MTYIRKSIAFTLIELLVVIAIISLLVSMLLPSLNRAKELAKSVVCATNLHQVHTTTMMYVSDHNGFMPKVYDLSGQWFSRLADYTSLGDYKDPSNRTIYLCPVNPKWYSACRPTQRYTNYGWSYYFHFDTKTKTNAMRNIKDVSYPDVTFLCGDVTSCARSIGEYVTYGISKDDVAYEDPAYMPVDVDFHLGGGQYVMVDGHTEWISRETDKTNYIRGKRGS